MLLEKLFILIALGITEVSSQNILAGSPKTNCSQQEPPDLAVVCVFTYNENENNPLTHQDPDGWLQTNVNVPKSANQLSICFHFYLIRVFNYDSSVLLTIDSSWQVTIEKQQLVIYEASTLTQVAASFSSNLKKWCHICVLAGKKLGFLLDGIEISKLQNGFTSFSQESVNLNIGVNRLLAPSNAIVSASYRFTHPRIIARQLSQTEVLSMSSCSIGKWSTNDDKATRKWSFNTYSKERGLSVTNLTIPFQDDLLYVERKCLNFSSQSICKRNASVCTSESFLNISSGLVGIRCEDVKTVCTAGPSTVYFYDSGSFTFDKSQIICDGYQGSLVTLTDEVVRSELMALNLLNFYAFLRKSDENSEDCSVMLLNKNLITSANVSCTNVTTNVLCQIPTNSTIELRLVRDNNTPEFLSTDPETFYFWKPEDQMFLYVSFDGSQIYWNGTKMFYNKTSGPLFKLDPPLIIFGKHQWMGSFQGSSHSDNSPTIMATYVITGCKENEYTCDSGQCIRLSLRCDGFLECFDQSDENDCNILTNTMDSSSKQATMPPSKQTMLMFTIKRRQVVEIPEDGNIINVNLQLTTIWNDIRLDFSMLRHKHGDNKLPPDGYWTPEFGFPNIHFDDQLSYDSGTLSSRKTYAVLTKEVSPSIDTKAKEEYKYNGNLSASIMQVEQFTARFFCAFQLNLFPFDVHTCHVNISVVNTGSFVTYFSGKDIVTESDEETLTMFRVSQFYISNDTFGLTPNEISVCMIVSRRFDSFFLTTFLPCLLITCLSNMTHLFDIKDFSNRIMVNLSCLIVLASLFAQVTSTLPSSPAPKAIEVFFFYCVAKCSLTFFLLSMINKMNSCPPEKKNQEISYNSLEYRPELTKIYPISKMFLVEELLAKEPESPKRKHFVSEKTIDCFCFYFEMVLDAIFVSLFFWYVYSTRSIIQDQISFSNLK